MDLSHLDKKYFVDGDVYNCPFCKRNNVKYSMVGYFRFDWSGNKECFGYLIQCSSCDKTSLHLSYQDLRAQQYTSRIGSGNYFSGVGEIDSKIFYSRPSSYFTLDNRIPDKIRQLIFEAEQSRQANLLVGASACLRKAVYELIKHEAITVKNEKTGRTNYGASIKKLKEKFSNVSPELFDALSNIQEMASDPLHEESWEAWDSPKSRFLIELVKSILDEVYVLPDEKKKRLGILGQLKSTFEINKKPTTELAKQ